MPINSPLDSMAVDMATRLLIAREMLTPRHLAQPDWLTAVDAKKDSASFIELATDLICECALRAAQFVDAEPDTKHMRDAIHDATQEMWGPVDEAIRIARETEHL